MSSNKIGHIVGFTFGVLNGVVVESCIMKHDTSSFAFWSNAISIAMWLFNFCFEEDTK